MVLQDPVTVLSPYDCFILVSIISYSFMIEGLFRFFRNEFS